MSKKERASQTIWRRSCKIELFTYMICHPVFLIFYAIFWKQLTLLCMFGSVRRRVPILGICLLFFLGCEVVFLLSYRRSCIRGTELVFEEAEAEGNEIVLRCREYEKRIGLDQIKYYRIGKKRLSLTAKDGEFYTVQFLAAEEKPEDKNTMDGKRDYLRLKLSAAGWHRKFFWCRPAVCLLILVTVLGAGLVVRSGTSYNGRLSWFLEDLWDTRYVELEHDNVFEYGIDGILEDIRNKIKLPKKLSLENSFSLHFAPDGTILSIETMVNGFDYEGNFVDSYLISYQRERSDKIKIILHKITKSSYKEEKDLGRLADAMKVIPLQTITGRWEQTEYGILYYGVRTWQDSDENVIYINSGQEIREANTVYRENEEHTGYSISLYCPEKENITPYRYLYVTGEEWNLLVKDAGTKIQAAETQGGTNDKNSQEKLYEIDSIEKVNKYMIPEQSFDVLLEDWGEVKFVSCKPSSFDFEDASFFLVKEDQILYKFPWFYQNNHTKDYVGLFESVGAVSFRDLNDDKKEDIIIITCYVSGAGPTGMVPHPVTRIFLAGENEFYLSEDMITEVEENISDKDMTIGNICNLLQNKK